MSTDNLKVPRVPMINSDLDSVFTFEQNDDSTLPRIISSCSLNLENIKTITADNIFKVNSYWKDRDLLYSTVKTYAALSGWKPTLTHKIYMRCSCFQRHTSRIKETKNTSKVSINKQCKWEIRIKSTLNRNQGIKTGPKEGTLKSIPVFSNGVPVIITKATCEHTGTCEPCSQQQMIVRQRSGQYVAKLSVDTIYTLCSMYTQFGILKSNIVKPYLQTAFPKNKNVTKHNIWSLKRKIKEISKEVGKTDDFVTFEAKFKSSNLEVGIEDMSSYDDNIAEIGQEMWKDLMNEKSGDDTFCTFYEYMQLISQNNQGFQYQFLQNNVGTITGCVWQTAVMRDNFEQFGGYICIDAMKRHINTLDWPYISVVMNNEKESKGINQ